MRDRKREQGHALVLPLGVVWQGDFVLLSSSPPPLLLVYSCDLEPNLWWRRQAALGLLPSKCMGGLGCSVLPSLWPSTPSLAIWDGGVLN